MALIRRVAFDTQNICGSVCHGTYLDWKARLLDPVDEIVEIIELLRVVWDRNLICRVDMIELADVPEDQARYWKAHHELSCNRAVIAIIQSLVNGQLDLMSYGGLLCAAAVNRDGSGGLISWGSTPRGIHNTN